MSGNIINEIDYYQYFLLLVYTRAEEYVNEFNRYH